MRNIPTITKNLLIINILAFLAYYVLKMRGLDLNNLLGLHFFLATDFQVWQLFTYMFMHANFEHIFFNMFGLWMFGCVIERVWGPKRFLIYYLVCGMGAGILQEVSQLVQLYITVSPELQFSQLFSLDPSVRMALNTWTTVGASGAIYAILLAFGMTFPEERIFIFPLPIPIKAKWFVMIYIVIELVSALGTGDNVAHFAHLGGMLFGFLLIRYWQHHPYGGSRYGRSNGQQFFDNLRNSWERRKNRGSDSSSSSTSSHNADWDYNSRKKKEEEEIDRILDKIRKNGYASLSQEEKKKLFDHSNKK
jgi:membrane associated rhomboid family serine protease